MLIYFCGSIRGGRDDVRLYERIVKHLKAFGRVLTEHVGESRITEKGEGAVLGDKAIHDRDVDWLNSADVVVAEVTQPSLGVGYELGRAVAMQKKILCLFRSSSGRVLSAMVRGAEDGSLFLVKEYTEDQMEGILKDYFSALSNN
ncbi:5-hydroxymethyl-dUMP N-hydrolase [Denticeps clupeoides]|uniref:2'-deoxynucleoside 5'-phosphate N-hydrolase 1 n=1 Tax=Denticeps clupeoides TaxID=299321 RepID=A0AAY4E5Y1_9TELE|nr:2'-deoxynucleoside 5'-phosphate N-hydrolase 1 [Denticeps clupeoides]